MVAKAGLRRLDIHSVRHTDASRLIANGENLKYVQEQLGHASITITCDTNGELIPGGNRQAVDKLDTLQIGSGTVTKAHEDSYAFAFCANTVASQAMYLFKRPSLRPSAIYSASI